MSTTDHTDVVIVGGGIVGLATAYKIQQSRPGTSVTVLEKEPAVAQHQTGHNSGVIHSGIYYTPGSLKAQLCKQGEKETKDFATKHGIPYRATGKLLVATNPVEKERMSALFERAEVNGLDVELLSPAALRAAEPHVRGLGAIRVAATSVIDYSLISRALAAGIVSTGGAVETGRTVTGIREEPNRVIVETDDATWEADHLVACAGLQADRIAKVAGLDIDTQIVPDRKSVV